MNLEEIRGAMEIYKATHHGLSGKYSIEQVKQAEKDLLKFVESVLSAEWPEKRQEKFSDMGDEAAYEAAAEENGFNAALDLCLLAHTKKMAEKIEEFERDIGYCEELVRQKDKYIAELKDVMSRMERDPNIVKRN